MSRESEIRSEEMKRVDKLRHGGLSNLNSVELTTE